MSQTLEMTTPMQPRGTTVARTMLLDTGYSISAFAIAVPAFVLAVIGISVGVSTLVVLVGLPVLVLTVYVARGFADLERVRLRSMTGRTAPRPTYLRAEPGVSWLRRILTPLRDPSSWLDLAWTVVSLATGTVAFSIAVTWWTAAVGGLTYWTWQHWIPFDSSGHVGLAWLLGLGDGRAPESWLNLGLGIFAALTLPFALRLATLVNASVANALLCSRAELQQQVARVSGGRDAARSAEASSLRRLERDIHDGPQQRLVRLQMDLGRAGKQLDEDPARARATIEGALAQARETVDELRSLSRGIAPPVLVDRGLEAALRESFARSTVPVRSEVDVPRELPPHVESTVYFVVSEALTNVAKHSGAARADVTVRLDDGRMLVRVSDDGRGGAAVGKGHGLAGLEQRMLAADGTLRIASPEGGPTTVLAELPCG
jgi:signal transduction histidine kinase